MDSPRLLCTEESFRFGSNLDPGPESIVASVLVDHTPSIAPIRIQIKLPAKVCADYLDQFGGQHWQEGQRNGG